MGNCLGRSRGGSDSDSKVNFNGGNVHVIGSQENWDKKVSEAYKEGKMVVANFSASWCGPCRMITPLYSELSLKYPQLVFLTVDVDELTMKYYIVFVGRRPGIYTTWEECHYNVTGFSGALHRAVTSREEAVMLFEAYFSPVKSSNHVSSINLYHPVPPTNRNTNVRMVIFVISILILGMILQKYLFG